MAKQTDGYKMYVARSYVRARNPKEARRLLLNKEPDELWISDDWKEGKFKTLESAIGFGVPTEE
jgi:hypothetical protein